jgi:hypothetical protein
MGKVGKSTDTYLINSEDIFYVELGNCSTQYNEYFSLDFISDIDNKKEKTEMYMNRDKLKGLADFIYNYLENN